MRESPGAPVPPHDLDAERALLGSLMLRAEALHDVIDAVTVRDFYAEKHQHIFEAMLSLFHKSEPVDLLTTTAALRATKRLEKIGGASYLSSLVNAAPAAANIVHYAQIVHSTAVLRRLIAAGEEVAQLGLEGGSDLETILDRAEKAIYEVSNTSGMRKFLSIKELAFDAIERIEKLHKREGGLRGIPTGFPELDALLSGLQPSDLVILAARPSMGKTAFALDIARNAAVRYGVPVGIFSLEMSAQQLVDRLLAAEAKVDAWKLRTGKLTSDAEFQQMQEALDRLSAAPIFIDDQPATTIISMRSVARRLKREKGLGLIVVDYLQLMSPTATRASDSLVQQVTEISRSLKALARELDVPVLALSQLSRAIEQRRGRPRLSDLRDSGSIEQDADVVMFIHNESKMREDGERNNLTEILVEKHRNGPIGSVTLFFDDRRATFLPVEKSDFGAFAAAPMAQAEDFSEEF
ncbi:replicative DNA helicase [Candidatus Parcubacteria bacterium]|nr:MAG: replicative DNA helicase [Candidatus Parcubacteria bacterium]